jgi:hypothetical protein
MRDLKGISRYIGFIWFGGVIAVLLHSLGYLGEIAGVSLSLLQTYTSVA